MIVLLGFVLNGWNCNVPKKSNARRFKGLRLARCLALVLPICFLGACGFTPSALYNGPNDIRITSLHSALPNNAFSASVQPAYEIPTRVRAGKRIALHFLITNSSEVRWPAGSGNDRMYQISIGNHWLTHDGKMLTLDDGRALLPYDLEPGARAEILLSVNAPDEAGNYVLEVEPVQEGVTWFSERGSKPLQLNVVVEK